MHKCNINYFFKSLTFFLYFFSKTKASIYKNFIMLEFDHFINSKLLEIRNSKFRVLK